MNIQSKSDYNQTRNLKEWEQPNEYESRNQKNTYYQKTSNNYNRDYTPNRNIDLRVSLNNTKFTKGYLLFKIYIYMFSFGNELP